MSCNARNLLAHAEACLEARDLDAAWYAFQTAEAHGFEADRCSAGRWMISMLRGDFASAWRESDAIRARAHDDPHRFWLGEDFSGRRVMLRCLHGLGDAVQMLRYASLIKSQAERLIVEAAPESIDLLRLFPAIDEVITWGPGAPEVPPAWDVQMEVNELPYIFRTQAEDLPLVTKYLKVPATIRLDVKAEAYRSNQVRIGLVWAGGDWNPARSVPPTLLKPLLSLQGAEFWNLQGGPARSQWQSFKDHSTLHAAQECETSLLGLAALIAQLDLIITPDTLAAHLAGAIGIPAWVMLQHAADWRWQHARPDSPWYPSLRLFRQQVPGDWSSVLGNIQSDLKHLIACRAHGETYA